MRCFTAPLLLALPSIVSSERNICAPEGFIAKFDGSDCKTTSSNNYCDYDFPTYAINGHVASHCAECGCEESDYTISTWHGETDIADWTAVGGNLNRHDSGGYEAMFDNDIWRSRPWLGNNLEDNKVIITFKKHVMFYDLRIVARTGNKNLFGNSYKSMCVVLDDNVLDHNGKDAKICTSADYDVESGEEIIFHVPKYRISAKKVELLIQPGEYAQIADLKIHYIEKNSCAPDGWLDEYGEDCEEFKLNESEACAGTKSVFDYYQYANEGYVPAHCKQCGCVEEESGRVVTMNIKITLSTAYTEELADPISQEYKDLSTTLISVYEKELPSIEVYYAVNYEIKGVTFTDGSDGTNAVLTIQFTSDEKDINAAILKGFVSFYMKKNIKAAIARYSSLNIGEDKTVEITEGLWSAWSPPGACSETCGDGMITKTRVCDGEGCPGADAEQTACNLKECHAGHPCNPNADSWTGSSGMDCSIYEYNGYCTADGKYGNQWGKYWGTWETYAKDGFHAGNCPACGCIKEETTAEVVDCEVGTCSQPCGGGKKTCQRQCLNGVFGQDVACQSADETKEEDCNTQACPSNPCPGSAGGEAHICWDYNAGTGACTFNTNTCRTSLTCSKTAMTITFDKYLFGTENDSPKTAFSTIGTCLTESSPRMDGSFTWTGGFGDCGMEIATEGSFITMKTTLSIGNTDSGITLGGTKIYASGGKTTTVEFKCEYASSATATSDDIDIQAPVDVSASVTKGRGSFATGLSLKHYTDANYNAELTTPIAIGSIVFPMITWEVTTSKIGFYIENCYVIDVTNVDVPNDDDPRIPIILNTCYAGVVSAAISPDRASGLFNHKKVKFSYRSFSFDTASADQQKISCTVQFCTTTTDGSRTCTGDDYIGAKPVVDVSKCPSSTQFNYAL